LEVSYLITRESLTGTAGLVGEATNYICHPTQLLLPSVLFDGSTGTVLGEDLPLTFVQMLWTSDERMAEEKNVL